MSAVGNETVLAESDDTVVVEGNHYYPTESLNRGYFEASEGHTTCPWNGETCYTIAVDGTRNPDAAWYYPDPKPAAAEIKGRVAFWRGGDVE